MNNLIKQGERLDDLLFNDMHILQNKNLYSFTSDAVLLANFAKAKKTDNVIDFCSGSGIVGILVQAKNLCKSMTLVELQECMCDMASRSVQLNNLQNKISVLNIKVQDALNVLENGKYDVIVCNPPYKNPNSHYVSEKQEIAVCKYEIMLTFDEICLSASKLLKFGGKFYFVNQSNRLCELISTLKKYNLEPKKIEFCYPAQKNVSNVVLVEAVKGAKNGVIITKTTN